MQKPASSAHESQLLSLCQVRLRNSDFSRTVMTTATSGEVAAPGARIALDAHHDRITRSDQRLALAAELAAADGPNAKVGRHCRVAPLPPSQASWRYREQDREEPI